MKPGDWFNNSATECRRAVAKEKMQGYLNLARSGKNEWWRFVLAIFLVLFMWQGLGALPELVVLLWDSLRNGLQAVNTISDLSGTPIGFVALMLASVFCICGIYLAVRFIHQRPFRTLITPARSIDWRRLFQGFGVWFTLASLMSGCEALLYPGRYVWTLDIHQFLPFAFLALIFIPIQTSSEELLFRAYVLQGLGLRTRNIWILSVSSGVLFALPHMLNPEASVNYPLLFLYYFAFGLSLGYITLRDGRLELALGAHAANNLFSAIFANYTITVLPTPSLFTIKVLDAGFSVTAGLIGMAIFLLLFTGPLRATMAPS